MISLLKYAFIGIVLVCLVATLVLLTKSIHYTNFQIKYKKQVENIVEQKINEMVKPEALVAPRSYGDETNKDASHEK